MFSIIRLVISGIILISCGIFIQKNKSTHKRLLSLIAIGVSMFLIIVLSIFPVENLLIRFDSPVAAYKYYYTFEKNEVELILEGRHCDFVVGSDKDNTIRYLPIPKNAEKYKIGTGSDIKRVAHSFSNGVSISVFRYKNSEDYFISILNTQGEKVEVSDKNGSQFYSVERENESLKKTLVTYYAYIPEYNSDYQVIVNGTPIFLSKS